MLVTDSQGYDGLDQTELEDHKKSAHERQDTEGDEMDLIDFNGQTNFS